MKFSRTSWVNLTVLIFRVQQMCISYKCIKQCRWRKVLLYPSIGSQVLVAQFKRFFLLFLPIVPSQQTEALPAAQPPANSLQRHSNSNTNRRVVFCGQVRGVCVHASRRESRRCHGEMSIQPVLSCLLEQNV